MIGQRGVITPDPLLYRIGRRPDPVAWPPWRFVGEGRFDDPSNEFRVLYACEQRRGCFAEVLAAHRPSLALLARLQDLPDSEAEATLPDAGRLPHDWRAKRLMALLTVLGDEVVLDLRDRATRERLRREMADAFLSLGLADFDLGDALTRDRRVTQTIARWAHEIGYQAIKYTSRHGADWDCWALFEGAQVTALHVSPIAKDDPDLVAVAAEFGLSVS